MNFSFVIPVYNRPQEVEELLQSLSKQTYRNFEVVIVEDGSITPCKKVVEQFSEILDIQYFKQENTGQGFARNAGFKLCKGDYFIVLDSDVLLPEHYLQTVNDFLSIEPIDAFGGPDKAHESFTPLQKAISYAMTSLFTTGGIRGKKHHLGPYHPRSFNMGLSRIVYEKIGGYRITRLGEDLDFSIRIIEAGFKTGLVENAYVYHKRRTNFKSFFRQLYFFGQARINIYKMHPKQLKLVHLFPTLFTLTFISACLLLLVGVFTGTTSFTMALSPFVFYAVLLFVDSLAESKSLRVAGLSVIASFIQLGAYGLGFISDFCKRVIFNSKKVAEEYPQ